MTTIHMDADAARAIQRKLIQLQNSILRVIQSSNTAVHGLAPHWRSSSADQFYGLYGDASSNISGIASELGEIAAEIANEIDQWESIASNLSH